MTVIDHRPWIGTRYWQQPVGFRHLIAGFSHNGRFSEDVDDDPAFTERTVEKFGGGGHQFFDAIAGYFGEAPAAFWPRVAFFNTLPSTVGDDRYAYGTPEQLAAVAPRVRRIIGATKPDRIFVFTTKGWRDMWPDYTGKHRNGTLRVDGVGEVECGTYAHADGESIAFGLRHPQYARTADMKAIVAAALAFTP